MPPTPCLPIYSETSPPTLPPMNTPALPSPLTNAGVEETASPSTMPPTPCLTLYSETSPPTLPPMNIPALPSPLTNAGVEKTDIFVDEFHCFEENTTSDCLVAAEPEARAMSFNKKELSMTVDDKDERSNDVVLDKNILLAEMVRKFIDVFN